MAQQLAVAEGAEGGRRSVLAVPPSLAVTGPVSRSLSLGFPPGPLGVREAHTTSGGWGWRVGTWQQPRLAWDDSSWMVALGTLPSGHGLLWRPRQRPRRQEALRTLWQCGALGGSRDLNPDPPAALLDEGHRA